MVADGWQGVTWISAAPRSRCPATGAAASQQWLLAIASKRERDVIRDVAKVRPPSGRRREGTGEEGFSWKEGATPERLAAVETVAGGIVTGQQRDMSMEACHPMGRSSRRRKIVVAGWSPLCRSVCGTRRKGTWKLSRCCLGFDIFSQGRFEICVDFSVSLQVSLP